MELRGLLDDEARERFLRPNYERDVHDPFLFLQMRKVVDRLAQAKESGEIVGVFGDFDADGVTSSVIIREALAACGIESVVYIPEKLAEGHGLNSKALDYFEGEGVTLVMTLDCGMMNHAEIEEAAGREMEVIIIDHHHVPEVLPKAYAIINPKLRGETYPFPDLCGAGTSFKVAQALYSHFLPGETDQLKWILDVVATGTVADVMPLHGENRALVKYGLMVLGKTRRVGFQAMIEAGRIQIDESRMPVARDIGFQIAPRINAASRMAHAMLAHQLLVEQDWATAQGFAKELEAHNVARQKISTSTADEVRKIVLEKYQDKKFIFAAHESYPYGIVGLIAGRIANEYRKPTCILTMSGEESRGSFRSVPEFNVIEALEKCSDLLVKYGGHAAAAGMTIKNEHLDTFYERFNALAEESLQDVVTEPLLEIDLPVLAEHLTPQFYQDLSLFAPFGEGNPEPILALHGAVIEEVRPVGASGKHLKLKVRAGSGGPLFEAIAFSLGERFVGLEPGTIADLAFTLDENRWNGRTSLQLKVLDMLPR